MGERGGGGRELTCQIPEATCALVANVVVLLSVCVCYAPEVGTQNYVDDSKRTDVREMIELTLMLCVRLCGIESTSRHTDTHFHVPITDFQILEYCA